eukprot:1207555-Rhodomonas_salina.4
MCGTRTASVLCYATFGTSMDGVGMVVLRERVWLYQVRGYGGSERESMVVVKGRGWGQSVRGYSGSERESMVVVKERVWW